MAAGKFEYKAIMIIGGGERTSRILNSYGAEGWELVSVHYVWFYFKRPIED